MAALTDRLPTENDSQQRFVNPAPATPSPLTSIFDFAGNVATVADKAWTQLEKDAKERDAGKRAAADEASKNNAVLQVVHGLFPYLQTPSNIPPASAQAYANAKPLAQQAANAQTAASQGKVDPGMAQAQGLSVLKQALAANPGHEYAVYQVFKEMKVDNMIMQQYDNAEKAQESDATSQQDILHKQQDAAVNKYGYSDFFSRSPQEQSTILANVGKMEADEQALDAKVKLADLTQKNLQITQSQRDDLKKQNSSDIYSSANVHMTNQFSNVMKLMINQLGDPTLASQPGRLEQLQSHFMNVALPALDLEYQRQRATLSGVMTPEDLTNLDKTFQDQRTAMVNMISGPQSVVESNKRIMEDLSTSFGIDYSKSAPTLMKLQKLIGPQALGVLLSPSVQGNAQLQSLMAQELKNVIADPTKMPSFTELAQSLTGAIDPSSWDPEKQKAAAPAMIQSMARLATDSPTFNGTDKVAHLALVNSIKQTAGIAVDVVPQWGFSNVLAQGKALNTRGVTTALFNTGTTNASDKIDAVHAWIPATTRTYMTLANMDSGDKYYSVKLDPHTLQWSAVWNGTKVPVRQTQGALASGFGGLADAASPGTYANEMVKPQPSTKVLEQASTLNHMLNNLAQAGHGGFDDTLGKGVSYTEARKYFATGELPQSLKTPASGKDKNGKTPEQNVDDAISHMLDFVNNLPTLKPVANLTSMPLASTVTSAAEAHGVPTDIALRLIHQESGGRPDVGASSKGAIGPGQIMPKTAAAYGKDVSKLSPEENVDLAMRILADNYKKTGNWADAVSMYHSGRTLADAAKHHSNDGNMSTLAYTSSITSVDPHNLASWLPVGASANSNPYGYARY